MKLKQDSSVGGGTFFVQFSLEEPCQKSSTKSLSSLRAVSVQSLSQKKFLVLDSDGDLHLLGLYSGLESTGHMKRLSHTMKVQLLAVLPDISSSIILLFIVMHYPCLASSLNQSANSCRSTNILDLRWHQFCACNVSV